MAYGHWTALLTLIAGLTATACGGGGGSSPTAPSCAETSNGRALCLVSCSLGCTETGCAISDIFQNQSIVLTFNQDVDPTSVTTASVSLRTPSGEEPVGLLLTQDNTVTFVPEIQVVGAISFFGFTPQENYDLRLPGGASEINALRSVSGDRFVETMTCGLRVTRGIVDLNGKPPTSELVSPSKSTGVAPPTAIVVEFDEIIDNTPFVVPSQGSRPIEVLVSRAGRASNGTLECSAIAKTFDLQGSWSVDNDVVRQVSTATFTPNRPIPTRACVTILVTTRVTDLAGIPSQGEIHSYITTDVAPVEDSITEDFSDDLQMDRPASGGSWIGGAAPGVLGWDGLHGDFDPALGLSLGNGVFEWNTENLPIPASNFTLSGRNEVVSDGVFRFAKFVLPASQTVRFVGALPPRIYVRGEMRIDGTLDVSGATLPEPNGSNPIGQAGGVPGPVAGRGGKGGDQGDGTNQTQFDGSSGESVQVPASHAYAANAAGTGGTGSVHFPDDNSGVAPGRAALFSIQVSAGGGGGGFTSAGEEGRGLRTENQFMVNQPQFLGPPAAGGVAFVFEPFVGPASVFDHYLIGGSGGGGAGSHPFDTNVLLPILWRSGGGGGGGGGAIGLRVGRTLTVGGNGRIDAVGGSTQASNANAFGTPGGGGSGGSIVIQTTQVPVQLGVLDVSGGSGGVVMGIFSNMESKGGDGSPGHLHLETPANPPAVAAQWTGLTVPPATSSNLAKLTETDSTTGVQSLFYETNQVFPPLFTRYVIDATVSGQRVTYTDAPGGTLALASQPIELLIQGAKEGSNGLIDPGSARPWRHAVRSGAVPGEGALADDEAEGYRWLLLFHEPGNTVHSVTVHFTP